MKKIVLVVIVLFFSLLGFFYFQSLKNTSEKNADANQEITTETEEKHEINLYYYVPEKDTADDTLDACHSKFVEASSQKYFYPELSIKEILTKLFEANLSKEDVDYGFDRFPFDTYDFSIKEVNLADSGLLTITFNDQTVIDRLDDCAGSVLVSSLQKTVFGFPEVKTINAYNGRITIPVR